MSKIIEYLFARLSEPSTYAGISTVLLSLGFFSPETIDFLFQIAAAVSGGFAIVMREQGTHGTVG